MKVAEVITARSAWLFDTFELNPKGVSGSVIANGLIKRYQFSIFPHKPEDFAATTGIQFNEGTFTTDGNRPLAVRLQIFKDGLIADTRSSTTETDAFLEDALRWAKTEFGLNYHPNLVKKRDYYSDLTIFPSFELTSVCSKFDVFAKSLAVLEPGRISAPQHLSQVSFKSENGAVIAFSFERREGAPFSENKYFSHAAVPTEPHIKLLNEFEKIMTG